METCQSFWSALCLLLCLTMHTEHVVLFPLIQVHLVGSPKTSIGYVHASIRFSHNPENVPSERLLYSCWGNCVRKPLVCQTRNDIAVM